MFLVYLGDDELVVRGYTDAGFQTYLEDSKAQSGYVFTLNGGEVRWKSSKQNTVADSTIEAEYVAASEAANEGYLIKKFVTKICVVPTAEDPVELYCDISSTAALAKDPRSHHKAKHNERKYHLVQDYVDKGYMKVCQIHTDLR
jgi:hypothetical protein